MKQRLERSVISILQADGISIVGTGFVVSDRLAVTCAHVIEVAKSGCGQSLQIKFYHQPEDEAPLIANVLYDGWSQSESDDVAFLELPYISDEVVPVVLGSADDCNGHSYQALGFASLDDYDSRYANDDIGGVVRVPDKRKRPMLQLQGEEIRRGMSGAPILDLVTNRVVGMVSEFLEEEDEGTRFGWATTADTLLSLYDTPTNIWTLRLWPPTYGPDELKAYLNYLIDINQVLKLPDSKEVMLECVYVSLRADEMNDVERKAEHKMYLEDVEELKKSVSGSGSDEYLGHNEMRKMISRPKLTNIEDKFRTKDNVAPKKLVIRAKSHWQDHYQEMHGAIVKNPTMQMHRNREFNLRTQKSLFKREHRSVSLAEVVHNHEYVVLLGDPGSGKTTLGRWLVLQHARAILNGKSNVCVKADLVQPGADAEKLIDLGAARLPIHIRIADYARARWVGEERRDNGITLERFLGHHHDLLSIPEELMPETVGELTKEFLLSGQALVILDGLDEVADPGERNSVLYAVNKFIQPRPPSRVLNQLTDNRILLTSRIVGYQFQPLIHLPHYIVEDMDKTAIAAFCRAWMGQTGKEDPEEQAQSLIDNIFSHSHPSVGIMAGNPLLLTILAQVYSEGTKHTLPTRRVELFDAAANAFYNQRKGFWNKSNIKPLSLSRALGAVASHIHANETTGFAEEGMVREQLRTVFFSEEQVNDVIEAARDVAGFLVARGEGVYGFLHRAVQEYFAAKHLVASTTQVATNIRDRALDPIWREPITLAVGMVSQRRLYANSRRHLAEVFDTILNISDPAGEFLPRRELLAAAACAECEYLPLEVGRRIAENLITLYARRGGQDKSSVLGSRIHRAFVALRNTEAKDQVEVVLCEALTSSEFERRYTAVNIIVGTEWYSALVARALATALQTYVNPYTALLTVLDEMIKKSPSCFEADFLTMRRSMIKEKLLWETASASQEWRAIIRVLYLPFGSNFQPTQINRDSPLTPLLVDTLRKPFSPDWSITLRQQLMQYTAHHPGTALARDSALVLSVLGDESWIKVSVESADSQGSQICPIVASLSRTLICTLAHDLQNAQGLANTRDQTRKLNTILIDARDSIRHLARARQRSSKHVHTRDYNHTLTEIRTQALTLAKNITLAREIANDLDLDKEGILDDTLALVHARAHDLARSPDRVRFPSRDLSRDLNFAVTRSRALSRARFHSRALTLDNTRSPSGPLDPVTDQINEYNLALGLVLELASDLARHLDHAGSIARAQASILMYNIDLNISQVRDIVLPSNSIQKGSPISKLAKNIKKIQEKTQRYQKARVSIQDNSLAILHDVDYALQVVRVLSLKDDPILLSTLERAHACAEDLATNLDKASSHSRTLFKYLKDIQYRANYLKLDAHTSQEVKSAFSFEKSLSHAQKLINARRQAGGIREGRAETLNQTRKLLVSSATELSGSQAHDLASDFEHVLTLASHFDRIASQIHECRHIHELSFIFADALNLASALTNADAYANKIKHAIQPLQDIWRSETSITQPLDAALVSIQTMQKIVATSTNIARALTTLIQICKEHWSFETKSSTAPLELDCLTTDTLEALLIDLASSNDVQRERAQRALLSKHLASQLGQPLIEQVAELAYKHADNPQVFTQLIWTLYNIKHDTPLWIEEWIHQAGAAEGESLANFILGTIHRATPETLKTILDILSTTSIHIQKTLLYSLSWLVRMRQVPKGIQPEVRKQLLGWLSYEMEPTIRCAIIEILGHWQEDTDNVGEVLLDLLDQQIPTRQKSEFLSLCTAVARQSIQRPNIVEFARKVLRTVYSHQEAASASVRFMLAQIKRENDFHNQEEIANALFNMLTKIFSDPSQFLNGLLNAGTDDDIWDDEYHGILVITTRVHLELHDTLLINLVTRFEETLYSQDWQARRFVLAVVAACTEVMPTALQQVSSGNLEALLVKATIDAESFNSRRFALTALGHLRTVTPAIVPALLAGCQDTTEVQESAIASVSNFYSIAGNPLPPLIEALTGESLSTAFSAAQLLGTLGASIAGQAAHLRQQITEALVNALNHKISQQEVIILGESKGKLEDALYTALLQAAGWIG